MPRGNSAAPVWAAATRLGAGEILVLPSRSGAGIAEAAGAERTVGRTVERKRPRAPSPVWSARPRGMYEFRRQKDEDLSDSTKETRYLR